MKKILIVEDEKFLAEIYRYKFVHSDFEVIEADSAEAAFEILEKEIPDLILLDILLPKDSGIDFLAKIRKIPKFSSIIVVAFSNYDEPKTKRKAIALGARDYLIKSNHTPQEIIDKINRYLAEQNTELIL